MALDSAEVPKITLPRLVTEANYATTLLAMVEGLANIGHWSLCADDRRLYWSDEVYRIHGRWPTSGSLELESAMIAYLPNDRQHFSALIARALETGEDFSCELSVVRPDGTLSDIATWGRAQHGSNGMITGIFGVSQDVTARKEAERERIRLDERIHLATKAGRIGIWERLISEQQFVADESMLELYGLEGPLSDLVTSDWVNPIHADDVGRIFEEIQAAEDGTRPYDTEYRITYPSGELRYLRGRGTVSRDAEGAPYRMIGVSWDVTEQRKAEREQARLTERMGLATEAGRVGIWELSIVDMHFTADKSMLRLYGIDRPLSEVSSNDWISPIHHADVERVLSDIQAAAEGRRPYDTEYRIAYPTGEIRHLRGRGTLLRDSSGAPDCLVGVNWDVTDLRRAAEQLHEEKELLRITLSSIGDAVVATDASAYITFMNPIAEKLLGWTSLEAVGTPLSEIFNLIYDESGESVESPVDRCLAARSIVKLEDGVSLISRDGSLYAIQDSVGPVRSRSGEIVGAVLVFQDVSDARMLQQQLSFSANHDALTGLANRTRFQSECQMALDLAKRSLSTHALCFIDLDRFKNVNDTAGHAAGDMVLQTVAKALGAKLRKTDFVGRLGGDEFGLLLRDCPASRANEICREIVTVISSMHLRWQNRICEIGASIGIAMISQHTSSFEDLVNQADTACYASKHGGRNRVSLFDDKLRESVCVAGST